MLMRSFDCDKEASFEVATNTRKCHFSGLGADFSVVGVGVLVNAH